MYNICGVGAEWRVQAGWCYLYTICTNCILRAVYYALAVIFAAVFSVFAASTVAKWFAYCFSIF